MKRIPKILFASALLLQLVMLTGCKPTEKNYQEAYDLARNKKEREEEHRRQLQEEMGVDFGHLQSVDNTRHITIQAADSLGGGSLTMPLQNISLKRDTETYEYLAAVAKFKMATNANSLAEDLRTEGFPEAKTVASSDSFFVVVADDTSAELLMPEILKFRSSVKDFPYVGVGEMMILHRVGPGVIK